MALERREALERRWSNTNLANMGFYGSMIFSFIALMALIYGLAAAPENTSSAQVWSIWIFSLMAAVGISQVARATRNFLPALLTFVLAVLLTEALLRYYKVPPGLIPTPSRVWTALLSTQQVLLRDAYTTFVLEALVGFIGGAVAGLLFALSIVRSRFLEQGLLPYASVLSSVPIVALAPILVKTIGLEWPSKAVIVGITVFFPVVVNVVRGLQSVNPLQLDLMRSYGSSGGQVFLLLRAPTALPFLFNALKIAVPLALIGAIVGETFGATGSGLGFRIAISVGRNEYDVAWAAIVVASIISLLFFGLVSLLERRFLTWHSSMRE